MWRWPINRLTEKVSTGITVLRQMRLDGFLFLALLVHEDKTMTTPESNPDEPIPSNNTPPRFPLSKRPPPSWSPFKKDTIIVTFTPFPPSKQDTERDAKSEEPPNRWILTFHSGTKVARPTLARLIAAIENLQPDEADRNGFVILQTIRADGSSAIFMQVCCYKQGVCFVEVGENKPVNGALSSLLKAGRREAAGAVVCESDVKTYENECLSSEEVIAIAEHYFRQQECHPDFQWRSIREEMNAFHQKSRNQQSDQDTEKMP